MAEVMKIGGITLGLLTFLFFFISSTVSSSTLKKGVSSYYSTQYFPSACFESKDGQPAYLASVSDALWDGGSVCGHTYHVRCLGAANEGTEQRCHTVDYIQVKVVDLCTNCHGATMLLSQEAFLAIAHVGAGNILVEFYED